GSLAPRTRRGPRASCRPFGPPRRPRSWSARRPRPGSGSASGLPPHGSRARRRTGRGSRRPARPTRPPRRASGPAGASAPSPPPPRAPRRARARARRPPPPPVADPVLRVVRVVGVARPVLLLHLPVVARPHVLVRDLECDRGPESQAVEDAAQDPDGVGLLALA